MVATLLAPAGFLYLAEFHPFSFALDDETGSTVAHDYFDEGPEASGGPGTYADEVATTEHNATVEWRHRLSTVVSAIAGWRAMTPISDDLAEVAQILARLTSQGRDRVLRALDGVPRRSDRTSPSFSDPGLCSERPWLTFGGDGAYRYPRRTRWRSRAKPAAPMHTARHPFGLGVDTLGGAVAVPKCEPGDHGVEV
ncbi:hypothetical protein [Streptomyces sp. F001]|uniref:hypothetical protein n=1 Tax=Streptomyces sp. F001 TaxID=1510026 RepID=UPI0026D756C6